MYKFHSIFILFISISLNIYAQNKVKLIQPEYNAMDVFDAHPNSSAIHPEARIEFTWEAIDNADSYEFYLIEKVHLDYGNPQFGDTLTTSNTSIIVGQPEGEKLPKHGIPYRDHPYAWRVRAIVGGEYQEWSELSYFYTGGFTRPNDKDQELLHQAGHFKPTTFDSVKFVVNDEFTATENFQATKEVFKAFGDLYANTSQRIYFFSHDSVLNQPIQEEYKKYGEPGLNEPHYMAFTFWRNPINDLGKSAQKGIGYGSDWSTVQEIKENHPFGNTPYPVLDFHEPTHLYEDGRLFSHSGMPGWFVHLLSNIHDFTFNRDYVSQIEAKYTNGEFCRDNLLGPDGNYYSSCESFGVDHVRNSKFDIEDFKNGTTRFPTHRDSLVNNDEHSYQPLAGYYLAHLTSPENVFLHFWDDRAFTKNYEDAFKDAFGMTLIEFNNKFYDWMMDIEDPLSWTDILPTEHSTELYFYPKRFTTTYPDSGAVLDDLQPSFEWIASTDFSDYRVQLSTSPDFSDTLHTMFIEGANSVYMDEVTFAQLDVSLDVNTTYYWRMQSILGVKESIWTKINSFTTTETATGNQEHEKKYFFGLEQNYPNPFNPRTMINFSLARDQHVSLEVFDINGRSIVKLIDKPMQAGEHAIGFHAALLSSGVYLYKLTTPSFTQTKKMLLVK
jgi:hypothetical protein